MNDLQPRNLIDRAIEAISPSWAWARYQNRFALSAARDLAPRSSYRGALATRTDTPWSTSVSYRGGSAADRQDLSTMRDRGRRAYRENVIARSLLLTETDNIVPAAFSLQMLTDSPEFNAEAEARFTPWLDAADVTGKMSGSELFRASWREPRKDGDGGFVLTRIRGYARLQYIPGDCIGSPWSYSKDGITNGIETDDSGRPLKFHLRDVDEMGKDTTTPVLADDFVYLAHTDGPLDLRGRTVYASVFSELDGLDGYKDAVVIAARMACIFGLIHKAKNPAAATGGLPSLLNSQGDQQKAVTLENGMLKVIGDTDDVFQVQAQQPMNQTPDFIRAMLRIICLAFDMPLEIGNKDLSQVNFSGGRIGLIGYYRSCRAKQEWLKSRCWNRIVRWWLSVERKRQELGYPDAFKTRFPDQFWDFELNGKEWPYNDPKTEAEADLLEISAGLKSVQMACEERGRDFNEVVRQQQVAREQLKAAGIPGILSTATRDEALAAAPAPTA